MSSSSGPRQRSSHLRRHLQSIALIDRVPALEYRVRRYFELGSRNLFVELRDARLCQADIVLCLLRINTSTARRVVESLVGRPIVVSRACRLMWHINSQRPRVMRQPVITWVCPRNPCRNSTRIGASFAEFKVGRTRQQLLMRGVSRGDIRRAVRRGWIVMAGEDAR